MATDRAVHRVISGRTSTAGRKGGEAVGLIETLLVVLLVVAIVVLIVRHV